MFYMQQNFDDFIYFFSFCPVKIKKKLPCYTQVFYVIALHKHENKNVSPDPPPGLWTGPTVGLKHPQTITRFFYKNSEFWLGVKYS